MNEEEKIRRLRNALNPEHPERSWVVHLNQIGGEALEKNPHFLYEFKDDDKEKDRRRIFCYGLFYGFRNHEFISDELAKRVK